MQKLASEVADKVREIEDIRQELIQIKEAVNDAFTAAKQAVALLSVGNRLCEECKMAFAIEAYEEACRLIRVDPCIEYHLGLAHSDSYDDDGQSPFYGFGRVSVRRALEEAANRKG